MIHTLPTAGQPANQMEATPCCVLSAFPDGRAFCRKADAAVEARPQPFFGGLQAHLRGGDWIDLMPDGSPGPPESKWCRNRMRPWLCVGPAADAAPGAREAEEFIEVPRRCSPLIIGHEDVKAAVRPNSLEEGDSPLPLMPHAIRAAPSALAGA